MRWLALRSPELTTEWGAYKGWLADRQRFREAVRAWDREGRPAAALATGNQLDEARSYFDRDGPEREFLEQSRYREWRENKVNRILKWVFMAIASMAIGATVAAVWGWISANNGWESANNGWEQARKQTRLVLEQEEEKREAIELGASAESTSTLAIGLLLMTEDPVAVHAAKKVLIIQTLRAVLFAGKGYELELAAANWKELTSQLSENDPQYKGWFKTFFEKTQKSKSTSLPAAGQRTSQSFPLSEPSRST